ncbi:MAG: SUF system Fe-S cluster assembly regulator [Kiloniellales bacterium]|nr:SUF system Fe-S cluster assembly regulator [Kiloniellales bacterium]
MFRLNRLTDYAVVVMAQMALRDKATMTASEIARDTGVPLPTVAKVLNALARDGLIVSQRGAAGGYGLSRPAAEIGVADIIQAIEGPIALTACVDGSTNHCDVEDLCPMRGGWDKVNRAIRGALDSVTLADMAGPVLGFEERQAAEDRLQA